MYPETSRNMPKKVVDAMHDEHEIEFWSKDKKLRCQYVALLISRFAVSPEYPLCDCLRVRLSAGLPSSPFATYTCSQSAAGWNAGQLRGESRRRVTHGLYV